MDTARTRQRTLLSSLGLVIVAVLFVAVVVLSNATLRGQRIDLTSDRLYTLSEGTRAVIQKIDEPITLRFYVSSRLSREIPSVGIYAQRVRDLLQEYEALSDGRLRLEVYDPEPFSPAEDRAVSFGLQGVPVDQSGELVYFGLAGTNAIDDRETIAFFDQSREALLEYDLTRVVYNLANPVKPKVGLITGLPLAGTPHAARAGHDDSWVVYGQLRQFFEVEMLSANVDEIPEDVRLLVLVHPKIASEQTLYAIDQFVLGGGQLLAFVDPFSEAEATMPQPGMPPGGDTSSNLPRLFEAWGIEVPADTIVGDLAAARRVQVPTESGQTRVAALDYPFWLALGSRNFNRESPVIAQLETMNIASPGHIVKREGAAVTLEPLITTSRQSGTVPASTMQGPGPLDPLRIANRFTPTGEPYVIAARLHGRLGTAFPDGPPKPAGAEGADAAKPDAAAQETKPEETGADATTPAAGPAHLVESAGETNIIVVADVDMLADGLWVRVQDFFGQRIAMPVANNGAFFINAVDNLSGSSDLIGLRSRGVAQRPFTEIQALQRQAEQRFRAKEQELTTKLRETEEQLRKIQGRDAAEAGAVLTNEQRAAIENFRDEAVRIRRELRDVQHALRRDVESLSNWIRAVNIVGMPLLVAAAALGVGFARRRYRRRPRLG
ncbi:MAG: GldG family protein [Alphaproteobacteria bacterium]